MKWKLIISKRKKSIESNNQLNLQRLFSKSKEGIRTFKILLDKIFKKTERLCFRRQYVRQIVAKKNTYRTKKMKMKQR